MLNSIDSCEFSTMSNRRWHVTSIGAAIVMAFLTMNASSQTPG